MIILTLISVDYLDSMDNTIFPHHDLSSCGISWWYFFRSFLAPLITFVSIPVFFKSAIGRHVDLYHMIWSTQNKTKGKTPVSLEKESHEFKNLNQNFLKTSFTSSSLPQTKLPIKLWHYMFRRWLEVCSCSENQFTPLHL